MTSLVRGASAATCPSSGTAAPPSASPRTSPSACGRAQPPMHEIANALTIDVEDYFQVSALAPYIPRSEWDRIPCRIERNMDLVLGMFAEHRAYATFFTLGW